MKSEERIAILAKPSQFETEAFFIIATYSYQLEYMEVNIVFLIQILKAPRKDYLLFAIFIFFQSNSGCNGIRPPLQNV